jgi:hypothetical protein
MQRFTAGTGLFGAVYAGGAEVVRRQKSLPISATAGSTEMTTYWSLPTRGWVNEVVVDLIAGTSAASTLSIGLLATTSGDADGFIATIPTSSAGASGTTGLIGGTLTYTSSGAVVAYYGALLCPAVTTNTTANYANTRVRPYRFDANTSSKIVSYTLSTTANGSLVANILVDYSVIP